MPHRPKFIDSDWRSNIIHESCDHMEKIVFQSKLVQTALPIRKSRSNGREPQRIGQRIDESFCSQCRISVQLSPKLSEQPRCYFSLKLGLKFFLNFSLSARTRKSLETVSNELSKVQRTWRVALIKDEAKVEEELFQLISY